MKKISICVPTWNRLDLTKKCFEGILLDNRVSEIVITDDNSTDGSFEELCNYYKNFKKVKLFKNKERLKVHGNKMTSVSKATNEWCVLFDSDNIITKDYLDVLYSFDWDNNTFYQPSFARPNFDYRHICGTYDKGNINNHIHKPLFECMLNTQNFFINRKEYLKVWKNKQNINGADSIFFNYLWLNEGNKISVVNKLEYDHLVHRGSFYESVAEESLPKSLNIIKQMNLWKETEKIM